VSRASLTESFRDLPDVSSKVRARLLVCALASFEYWSMSRPGADRIEEEASVDWMETTGDSRLNCWLAWPAPRVPEMVLERRAPLPLLRVKLRGRRVG
jgi:hypothetical protein